MPEYLYQKLSEFVNWFSGYSCKCQGCFFGTQCNFCSSSSSSSSPELLCDAQFYADLSEMLLKCQSKVGDFCAARDAEKEDLLQDLSVNMGGPPHPSHLPPDPQMSGPYQHPHAPLQIPAYQQQPGQCSGGIFRSSSSSSSNCSNGSSICDSSSRSTGPCYCCGSWLFDMFIAIIKFVRICNFFLYLATQ